MADPYSSDDEFAAAPDSSSDGEAAADEGMQLGNVVSTSRGRQEAQAVAAPPQTSGAETLKVREPPPAQAGRAGASPSGCQVAATAAAAIAAALRQLWPLLQARCPSLTSCEQAAEPTASSQQFAAFPLGVPSRTQALPAPGRVHGLQMPTFEFASKRRQRQDDRLLLLFDINGVLVQHRFDGFTHQASGRAGGLALTWRPPACRRWPPHVCAWCHRPPVLPSAPLATEVQCRRVQ